jgi:hypothetical protein
LLVLVIMDYRRVINTSIETSEDGLRTESEKTEPTSSKSLEALLLAAH